MPISDQTMWLFLPYMRTEQLSSRVHHVSWKPYSYLKIKICDFPYPISELNCCPWEYSMWPGNLIPISDQNMWFFLPYIRTVLLSSRVQHVTWKPYSYFRSKYVIFPTLYQNWTAVLESPPCVLETLFLFQIKICDFSYPISELNCCPQESSMWPGNLIPISDQNMWFFLPYIRTELLSSRVQHVTWKPYSYFRSKYVIFPTLYQNWTTVLKSPACDLETLFLFQIKICDFPYPISELNCCPWEYSMWPGNLIPISDQNMWFFLPYIRTELLSSRVQHVTWKPYSYFRTKYVIFPTLYQNRTAVLESPACDLETLFLFQIKICDFSYPISELNCCPQESSMWPGNLIPISDQNMWFSLPYIRTELPSSRVQHVTWKPYSYFRSKYVIFPTLYQNWTAVLESIACDLETLFLFQIKICDFSYPISELNCCPQESSMWPGNLIPISDQNMWFSLPYIRTELLSSRVQHVTWKPYSYFRSKYVIFPTLYQNWTAVLESTACDLETLFLFQIKICDFSYPISELNCCPQESSMWPGNLIPISEQNMWFSLPYIRTELLSLRVQHVTWKPYSYFRSKYVIFPTLYQNWTAVLRVQHVTWKPYSYFRSKYMYTRKFPT